jgi:hypothetical protein
MSGAWCDSGVPARSRDDALAGRHQRRVAPHGCGTHAVRRWDCLTAAGLNLTSHVFLAVSAADYKPVEWWAFGKGIAASHIINSGTSLGDTR